MYRWIITKEMDIDGVINLGTCGPRNYDKSIVDNKAKFSLYDDDGNCYAEGLIFGEYDGFEPLDDYGMPSLGCTAIKIDGEWL